MPQSLGDGPPIRNRLTWIKSISFNFGSKHTAQANPSNWICQANSVREKEAIEDIGGVVDEAI